MMLESEVWPFIMKRIDQNVESINSSYPYATRNGVYELASMKSWISGFWPGMLWQAYQSTGDVKYLVVARELEGDMDQKLANAEWLDHDIGFIWSLSSVSDYKLTANQEARRRALLAANLLMGRFNVAGNFIRAWNDQESADTRGYVIIDSVMNLPILFWASEETQDPRYRHLANAHLETLLKYFLRSDGSVCHTCIFDPETGDYIKEIGNQSFGVGSAWARGTAWALYGFTLAYHYTKDQAHLNAAESIANFFLKELGNETSPKWDFRAEAMFGEDRILLDSSAAAIAAAGLVVLHRLTENHLYIDAAKQIVSNLYTHHSTKDIENHEGIITDGVGNYLKQKDLGVSLIYGDYFYTEAVSNILFNNKLFW